MNYSYRLSILLSYYRFYMKPQTSYQTCVVLMSRPLKRRLNKLIILFGGFTVALIGF